MASMHEITEIAAARSQQIEDLQDELRLIDVETPNRRLSAIAAEIQALKASLNSVTRHHRRTDERDEIAEIGAKIDRLQSERDALPPRLDKALDRKARINDELRRLQTDPNPLPDIDISEVIAAEKRLAEIDQAIAQASRNHAAENERLIMMVAPRSALDSATMELEDARAEALPETTIASLREKQTDERERFDAADRAMTTAREAVQEHLAGLQRKIDRLKTDRDAIQERNTLLRAAFLQSKIRAARKDYAKSAQDFLKKLAILGGLDRLSAKNDCRLPVFADHRRGCILPALQGEDFAITDLDIESTADQLRGNFRKEGILL